MELHVLGSSSKGNCYLLKGESETLILEAGIPSSEIIKALDFDLSHVVGCLVTHEHMDHAFSAKTLTESGIKVCASAGTLEALGMTNSPCTQVMDIARKIGSFTVIPLKAKHDAAEPLIYLIFHPNIGHLLFATDTYLVPYDLRGVSHFVIEANYSQEIIKSKLQAGEINKRLVKRIINSHLSLDNCLKVIEASGTDFINTVTLIHLSDSNSDAGAFKEAVQRLTGKPTYIADKGLKIELTGGN